MEERSYALVWIGLPEQVQLAFDRGHGSWVTLVEPVVFTVGANDRYVVAQQHPGGDKAITNYFIIEVQAGPSANSEHGIIGPLTEQAFHEKTATLRLPPFTKIVLDPNGARRRRLKPDVRRTRESQCG